jgi:hypothetical protein
MPIVEALGNRNLRAEHWHDIRTILSAAPEFPLEERAFTLGELIDLNVATYQEDIVSVSVTATQEFNLRNQLEEVR